jgi:acetyltransferase-like isoleucine patch superfamily enzyme
MERPIEFEPGSIISESVARNWLGACGVGVKLYSGCRILHPEKVRIGDYSQIDEGVFISPGRETLLGRHVHLAIGSSVSGGGSCFLADFVGIGAGTRLITGTDVPNGESLTNPTIPFEYRIVQRGSIKIGAHALIFTNCVVLPEVAIGEGAVVAAGSVVHHDLRPWAIYAGHPLVQVGVRPAEKVLRLARELLATEQSGETAKELLPSAESAA